MRPPTTPTLLLTLLALAAALADVCDHDACTCDGFSGVRCSCTQPHQELTIQSDGYHKLIPTTTRLEIYNCSRVYVESKAFKNLSELKRIKIFNVEMLKLTEHSFEWLTNAHWGIRILIQNTTIPDLPSYLTKGQIDEFQLNAVHVQMLHSFAVSSISGTKNVEITNSVVDVIETQAFKKFVTNTVTITNNTFNVLPSRTFSDVFVSDFFILNNNRIRQIRSSFIIVNGLRRLTIENNQIGTMDGESFKVLADGNVFINNNTIDDMKSGALLGLTVRREVVQQYRFRDLYFQNNTINAFQHDSFAYDKSSYTILPKNMFLERVCDCALWNVFNNTEFSNALYCNYESGQRRSLDTYKEDYCVNKGISQAIMIIGIVVIIIIVLVIILSSVLIYRKFRAKVILDEQIRPEGKTYKETELYVIVEKTDLLTTDF